jgi:hypothetical protein
VYVGVAHSACAVTTTSAVPPSCDGWPYLRVRVRVRDMVGVCRVRVRVRVRA